MEKWIEEIWMNSWLSSGIRCDSNWLASVLNRILRTVLQFKWTIFVFFVKFEDDFLLACETCLRCYFVIVMAKINTIICQIHSSFSNKEMSKRTHKTLPGWNMAFSFLIWYKLNTNEFFRLLILCETWQT